MGTVRTPISEMDCIGAGGRFAPLALVRSSQEAILGELTASGPSGVSGTDASIPLQVPRAKILKNFIILLRKVAKIEFFHVWCLAVLANTAQKQPMRDLATPHQRPPRGSEPSYTLLVVRRPTGRASFLSDGKLRCWFIVVDYDYICRVALAATVSLDKVVLKINGTTNTLGK